jgi:hypothetical protein
MSKKLNFLSKKLKDIKAGEGEVFECYSGILLE